MPTASEPKGDNIQPVPAGQHPAICQAVWGIGTQYSDYYKKSANKIIITWELPNETIEIDGEDKRRLISKAYTNSLHKKAALRQDLENWRGREFSQDELSGFDLKNILGKPCMLQIIHRTRDDKKFANVTGIMTAPPDIAKNVKLENDPICYDVPNEIPESCPEWIANLIKRSTEWARKDEPEVEAAGVHEDDSVDDVADDLPF